MNVVKRGFLYVFRKRQQSLITFLVLLAVSTATLTCLAVLDASRTAAANLRGQFGGTFRLEIDMSSPANMQSAGTAGRYTGSYYTGDTIDNDVIDEVLKTSGISDYSASIEAVANLKSGDGSYCGLVENTQNYYSSPDTHLASIHGWTSLEQCPYFANGILEVAEGTMFSDETPRQAVISRELAELNQIAIGDQITLEINREVTGFDFPAEKQECMFEIIGIFDILGKQQISQYTGQRQMLQNWVFVNSRALLPYLNELLKSIGEQPIGYEKVTFSVNDPAEMGAIIKNIEENSAINWNCFKIEADDENYQSVKSVLDGMNSSVRMMILTVVLSGIGILVLLLAIQTKFRIRETGLMLALGFGKGEILAQRAAEIALIAALAFSFSYAVGSAAANSVGNILLTQAHEQASQKSPSHTIQPGMTISSGDMDLSPVFAAPKVEELAVTITTEVYAKVYTLGLLTALLSSCIVCSPVMRAKPKEILSKMS